MLSRLADARPLALFRIAFYATIIVDAVERCFDLDLLSDDGILPREILRLVFAPVTSPLAYLVGTRATAALLLAVGIGAALCAVVGLFTRVASVVVWLYLVTLHSRNPFILDGSDQVMSALAFFAMFADLDAVFSLRPGPPRQKVRALPVVLLQGQVALVHLAAGLAKHGALWRSGDALYCVLQSNDYVRPTGMSLLAYPLLCKLFTYAALATELAFLPLVFSPFRRALTRPLALVSAAALHLGIFAIMRIGMFPLVMCSALLLFVPPALFGRAPPAATEPAPPRPLPPALAWGLVVLFADVTLAALLPASWRKPFNAPLDRIGVGQHWSMFAPGDSFGDGYFVGRGTVAADGRVVEPLAQTAPRMLPQTALRFSRWYKLRDNVGNDPKLQLLLLRYLCRQTRPPLRDATLQHFLRRAHRPDERAHPFMLDANLRWQCVPSPAR